MSKITEYTVENISEFVQHVTRLKNEAEEQGNPEDFLFRGQPHSGWGLVPKLARPDLRLKGNISEIETKIISEFRRNILPLSEFKPQNDWDLLALAQHHGLPTRMLDWTLSGFVALWFAVKNPPFPGRAGKRCDGAVWIFVPTVSDFRQEDDGSSPFDNKKITKVLKSKVISRRISAQSGVFTVHKITKKDDEEYVVPFQKNPKYNKNLKKLVISAESFSRIRKDLDMFGVNESTIFPDIDGLCGYLQWRNSLLADEDE